MKLLLILLAVVIVGTAVAGLVLVVVWRAVGAAFDWLVITFGNESARREVLERYARRDDRLPPGSGH